MILAKLAEYYDQQNQRIVSARQLLSKLVVAAAHPAVWAWTVPRRTEVRLPPKSDPLPSHAAVAAQLFPSWNDASSEEDDGDDSE